MKNCDCQRYRWIGNNDNKYMQIMESDQTDDLQSDCARIFELVFVCVYLFVFNFNVSKPIHKSIN